jgi:UDP-N-acetylglucosamine 4,6-dehydratase/5-epimerase
MRLDNKKIFVTGGTGTIGGQVVKRLLEEGAFVTIYSRDQNKQFKMNYDIASKRVNYVNGDICDLDILTRSMHGCSMVVHCAASKHVPLCETNVDSSIKNNIEGTRNVLKACIFNDIKKFLQLSTDKAVNPSSVMGATKFIAERLVLEFNKSFPCSIVRLGNVFASNGSVVPTFADRIKHGLPLVINDPNAIRYFISQKECGEFIVDRLCDMKGGEIFIKKMKLMTVKQLADCMTNPGYPMEFNSLTQGEKLKESLVTSDEAKNAFDNGDFIVLNSGKKNQCDSKVEFFTNEEIHKMLRAMK